MVILKFSKRPDRNSKYKTISTKRGNFNSTKPDSGELGEGITKYYINNPTNLMKSPSSGGVEAATAYIKQSSSHTIRLSISPSQGDDPGFKSRPEHSCFVGLNTVWGYF